MSNCSQCNVTSDRSVAIAHFRRCHSDLRPTTPKRIPRRTPQSARIVRGSIRDIARGVTRANVSANVRANVRANVSANVRRIADEEDKEDRESCVICMEPGDCELRPCHHKTSCRKCLLRWWQESFYRPRCPVCRTDVKTVFTDRGVLSSIIGKWEIWRAKKLNGRQTSSDRTGEILANSERRRYPWMRRRI